MSKKPMYRLLALGILAWVSPSGLVPAQAAPLAWTAGASTVKLRPSNGADQVLNGFAVGCQVKVGPDWSAEATLVRQTGTQAGTIDLRQLGFLAGPRFSLALRDRWEAFAHAQIGWMQFRASEGPASDQSSSLAFGPGFGVDFAVAPRLSIRGQGDLTVTHYGGAYQTSPSLFLGLVLRP